MQRTKHPRLLTLAAICAALSVTTCKDVNVTAVDPARIEITPANPVVQVAETVALAARVLSREGRPLQGRAVTWRVANEQVATIDASGTVNGVSEGSTYVHAQSGEAADSVLLTVEPLDPVIAVAPAALMFTGRRGGSNPDAQTVAITNAGGRTLEGLTVTVVYPGNQAGGWITTSLSAEVAPATLTIGVNIGSLGQGTYTGTVNIASTGAANSPQALTVTLELADALPRIGVSASTAAFAADVGGANPAPMTLDVTNTGGGTLNGLTATVSYPSGQQTGWLSAALNRTTAPATLTLTAATGTLPVGTHAATVRVASPAATDAVTINATFAVGDVPPTAPSGLTATVVSPSRVDLAWQAAAGTVDEYRIEQRTGTSGAWREIDRVDAGSRTYQSTGLAAATQYSWRVLACNAVGCSQPSGIATATTHPLPPGAPGALSATTVSTSEIELSWNAPAGPIDEYRVERATGGGGFTLRATLPGSATGYDDRGLAAATTYTYRVQACNTGGCSAFSNPASATTYPPPPGRPGTLTATVVSQTRIDLAWEASSGTVGGYVIERRTGMPGQFAVIDTVTTTTFVDNGLAAATTYTYRVRACNPGGCSPFTNMVTRTTLPNPPGTPGPLTAAPVSSEEIEVSWSAPSGTVDEYRLQRRTAGGSFALHATLPGSATEFEDDALSPATQYFYRVQACNTGGCSAFTGEVSATTLPLPPGVPGALSATTISASRIDLAWGASTGVVTGYEIERRTGAGAYAPLTTVSGATTFQDTGLSAETSYVYRVRACNPGGCSAFGNEAAAATLPLPPGAPTLTVTSVTETSITLSWSGATGTVTEYRVERVDPDPGIIAVLSELITSHTDVGLSLSTQYRYRVMACNPGGCSPPSNEVSATTLPEAE